MSGKEASAGTAALNAYIGELLPKKKQPAAEDLIGMIGRSEVAKTMTDREVVANSTQLVFAGSGTTTSLMSVCVVLLAQHPDQRRLLVNDRSLVPQAIEEVMRFMDRARLQLRAS